MTDADDSAAVNPPGEQGSEAVNPPGEVTILLERMNAGNREAIDMLMPLVYDELRRIASRHLQHERPDHTLQPTALVHEAFLRMVDQRHTHWRNRLHFLGVAATMMRRVLIDHAKARHAARRGGVQQKLMLEEGMAVSGGRMIEVLAIDEALTQLGQLDALQARVVELRFFGGLSVEETAEVLDISPATVKRYWNSARAWLHAHLIRRVPKDTQE